MQKFPENFLWGAATASYQIEGGVNEGGRGATIWDSYSHIPGNISNDDNGDIACDHFHQYKDDVQIMKEMGLQGYRFSIAWSRIFPDGSGTVNQKGLDFYNNLIDELLQNGIDPMVTLYHWDLPQALQNTGGWNNRDTVDYFVDYAETVFSNFGDRVKKWVTHNEPWVTAYVGNYIGRHAPGFQDLALAVQVSHHLILSHAKTVELYKGLNDSKGKIGISLNLYPVTPATNSEADKKAAELVDDYNNNWFLDPVLKGKYPEKLFTRFKEKLDSPVIMSDDMAVIKRNPCDFIGINYYFRKVVKESNVHPVLNFEEIIPEGAVCTEMNWEVYPQGLYDLMKDLKEKYDNPHLYITENGAAFKDTIIESNIVKDNDRLDFLKTHFNAAFKAISEGVKLDGYYVWSLMDNFEWGHGYSKRFGLIGIDYKTQKRMWKESSLWYKNVIKNNGF